MTEAEARKQADELWLKNRDCYTTAPQWLIDALVSAGKAPKGCIIDETGAVTEIPIQHPRLPDGSVLFIGQTIYGYNINGQLLAQTVTGHMESWPSPTITLAECHRSPAARRRASAWRSTMTVGDYVTYKTHTGDEQRRFIHGRILAKETYQDAASTREWFYVRWYSIDGRPDGDTTKHHASELEIAQAAAIKEQGR